ncbi:MAG: hypothetical protein Q9184_004595 [Pyrenodesmia sp. 2 TL-2023]
MPALVRRGLKDDATAKASSGWHTCLGKTGWNKTKRYPAIIGIILALALALLALYCLLRFLSCCCCDCLSGGRYRRHGKSRKHHKYADLHATPYTGYQGAANTGYNQQQQLSGITHGQQQPPPQYTYFENGSRGGEDSLPRMPVWGEAGERRVYESEGGGDGKEGVRKEKELEYEREQRLPMLADSPAPRYKEVEMDAAGAAGDLGRQGGLEGAGYKPFGAAYRPYEAGGKEWRGM